MAGKYSLQATVASFDAVNQPLIVRDGESLTANVQLKLAAAKEEVKVSTEVLDVNVMTLDPAQRFDAHSWITLQAYAAEIAKTRQERPQLRFVVYDHSFEGNRAWFRFTLK